MGRPAKAYTDNAPALDPADDTPDTLPGGQRRVVRMPASVAPALQLPAGAVSSVFAAGQQAKNNRGRRRQPALDVSALQVHDNLAPPTLPQQRGRSKYDWIFAKLSADGMAVTGIPRSYYGGLTKACEAARKRLAPGSRYLVRTLDSTQLGVFRVAVAKG